MTSLPRPLNCIICILAFLLLFYAIQDSKYRFFGFCNDCGTKRSIWNFTWSSGRAALQNTCILKHCCLLSVTIITVTAFWYWMNPNPAILLTSYHWESELLINSTHRGSDLELMSLSRRLSQDTVSSTLVTHCVAMVWLVVSCRHRWTLLCEHNLEAFPVERLSGCCLQKLYWLWSADCQEDERD